MTRLGDGRRSLTDRGRVLLSAGVTLAVTGAVLGFIDLVRVGTLVLALPLLARLFTRGPDPRLRTHRATVPSAVAIGGSAEVHIEITNEGGRRTPVLLAQEELSADLGSRTRFVLGPIAPGGTALVSYRFTPRRRGRHRAGPLTVHRLDPFGLSTRTEVVPGELDLVVLPRLHPLIGLTAMSGGGYEGSTPTMVVLHGEDDASIRGYRQGDDVRRVHWPATAHRGALMVRHEGRPSIRRAILLVDGRFARLDDTSSADAGADALPCTAHDWAVEALASVAAHLAEQDFHLHVVTPQTVAEHTDVVLGASEAVRTLAVALPWLENDEEAGAPWLRRLAAARDLCSAGGLLVAAVSDNADRALHDLLSLRGPACVGLVFILAADTFPGEESASAAVDPGPAAGAAPPRSGAEELAALARSGGWHAVVVRDGDEVLPAWRTLSQSAALAGSPR